ncbi:unnamed protein product [Macrosiphum euphorbiae]|uniref:Uncharacterized protein n=1 Tax=Macrosiphum euphorbiae TaxID=13131 RepID=A0AAV0WLZ0_9HEMI|nr:unnamed protein product [Macrosiphum euphorbiae]
MTELTSLILLSCYELTLIGKFICKIWCMFFDNSLSTVLTTLETVHEKLIRLNVDGLKKIKNINWISISIIIVNIMVILITTTIWMIMHKHILQIKNVVIILIQRYFLG